VNSFVNDKSCPLLKRLATSRAGLVVLVRLADQMLCDDVELVRRHLVRIQVPKQRSAIDEHAALLTNQFLTTGGGRNLTKFFFLLNTSSRFSLQRVRASISKDAMQWYSTFQSRGI
jgi:hypothetical protein